MTTTFTAERLTLAAAAGLTVFGLTGIPSWHDALSDVCHQAAICGVVTVALLCVTRFLGSRGIAIERTWAALFLAGMPLVYIQRSLITGGVGPHSTWFWIELAALPLFGALAVLGLRRSPWFLVAGIAAHGLAWDAWHYLNTDYIPTWYVTGCLLQDVGLSLYFAARIGTWERSRGLYAARVE